MSCGSDCSRKNSLKLRSRSAVLSSLKEAACVMSGFCCSAQRATVTLRAQLTAGFYSVLGIQADACQTPLGRCALLAQLCTARVRLMSLCSFCCVFLQWARSRSARSGVDCVCCWVCLWRTRRGMLSTCECGKHTV